MEAWCYGRLCDYISDQAGRFANTLKDIDFDRQVDLCPGWTVGHLVAHVYLAFAWAGRIVSSGECEFLPPHTVFPEIPADSIDIEAAWPQYIDSVGRQYLNCPSGQRLIKEQLVSPATDAVDGFVAALRAKGPDAPAWTTFGDQSAAFWAQWGALEIGVHRADAELALGAESRCDPDVSLTVLDFFFTALTEPTVSAFLDPRAQQLRRSSECILFQGDGSSSAADRQWLIRLGESGPALVTAGGQHPDAVVRAPGDQLLLLLKRRLPATDSSIGISGDTDLVGHWLDHILA